MTKKNQAQEQEPEVFYTFRDAFMKDSIPGDGKKAGYYKILIETAGDRQKYESIWYPESRELIEGWQDIEVTFEMERKEQRPFNIMSNTYRGWIFDRIRASANKLFYLKIERYDGCGKILSRAERNTKENRHRYRLGKKVEFNVDDDGNARNVELLD